MRMLCIAFLPLLRLATLIATGRSQLSVEPKQRNGIQWNEIKIRIRNKSMQTSPLDDVDHGGVHVFSAQTMTVIEA